MARFQKLKFGNTRNVHRHTGKGASEQTLPNRSALNSLTKGDTFSRSMNDYAKATPGPETDAPDINDFAAEAQGSSS